jgi:hypothetical protein
MKTDKIIKDIKSEMNEIKKQYKENGYGVKDFLITDIDDMSSGEAFDRGYYRALESILSDLKE